MTGHDPVFDRVVWILHGGLYHAFELETPPVFPVVSECGYHSIGDGRRKAMGAARCIECAVALGQDPPDPAPLEWAHNGPQKMGCRDCNQPVPDSIGTTDAGIVAPQSAINALRKRSRSNSG